MRLWLSLIIIGVLVPQEQVLQRCVQSGYPGLSVANFVVTGLC